MPLYIQGNTFHIHGGAKSSPMLEGILEGQMAPQYFPVQTLKNMGASIEIVAIAEGQPFSVEGCQVTARTNPHGRSGALAFRVEDAGRVLVYASDAGYPKGGAPRDVARALRERRRAHPRQHVHARGSPALPRPRLFIRR